MVKIISTFFVSQPLGDVERSILVLKCSDDRAEKPKNKSLILKNV